MNPQPPPVPPDDVPPLPAGTFSPPPSYCEPPVVAPSSTMPGALKVIGIGCGVLALTGVIVVVWTLVWGAGKFKKFVENPEQTIVEMALKGQPDLEFVKSDSAAKTVTVRNKVNGEEMTMNFGDIRQGHFKMTGPDGSTAELTPQGLKFTDASGTVSMASGNTGDPPAWLPPYPRQGEVLLSTRTAKPGSTEGVYIFSTEDSVPVAVKTCETILHAEFSNISSNRASIDGMERGELSGTKTVPGGGQQKISINIVRPDNRTIVTIQYGETAK